MTPARQAAILASSRESALMAATTPITEHAQSATPVSASLAELGRRADALSRQTQALAKTAQTLDDSRAREMPAAAERNRQVGELHHALDELDTRVAELTLAMLRVESDLIRTHS